MNEQKVQMQRASAIALIGVGLWMLGLLAEMNGGSQAVAALGVVGAVLALGGFARYLFLRSRARRA